MEVVNNGPARRITGSFLLIVAVAFIVTMVLAYDIHQNRAAIHRIKQVQAAQREFRVERAARTGATDHLICAQLEKVKAVIRGVVVPTRQDLLRLSYYREHPREIPVAIRAGRKVAVKFAPINCAKLPSTGGAFPKPRKKGKR